jgi:hypothetical protein
MRPIEPPPIVARQARDLLAEMIRRIPAQFPQWKPEVPADDDAALALADDPRDFGMALLKLAAHMGEVVAGQINRVPHKSFLAFLDFLGMDRAPPRPARVPLTFALAAKAPADSLVPKGTRVGLARRDDVVFETETDLLVTRAVLSGAFTVDPYEDSHADLGRLITEPGTHGLDVFGRAGDALPWLPNTHALHVGHDTLFSQAGQADADITVMVQGTLDAMPVLEWAYSTAQGWQPALATVTAGNEGSLAYVLKAPGIAPLMLAGHDASGAAVSRSGCWLRARSREAVAATVTRIDLAASIVDRPVPSYLACFNTSPLDTTKDFSPFGERPRFNDTLYLASRQAFGTPGARVRLEVALSQALAEPVHPVTLSWEYWDGTAWRVIGTAQQDGAGSGAGFGFSDTTQAFTRSGAVEFDCPPVAAVAVQGQADHWVRARIVSGGYGQEAGYQRTTNEALQAGLQDIEPDPARLQSILELLGRNGLVDTFVYVADTFAVPSIRSLALSYSIASTAQAQALWTENSFVLRDETAAASFQPFVAGEDDRAALYLEFDPATTWAGTPLNVYLQVVQPLYGWRSAARAVGAAGPAAMVWWYWNGTAWKRLSVEDETGNLARSGLLRFIWPADARPRPVFGRRRLWVRARLEAGGYATPPRLGALSLNTVWASHGVTFRDHVLGSSNGDPGQEFRFTRTPVLQGQVVEVREPTLPGDAERRRIAAEQGQEAVRTVLDAAGNVLEVWVRWHAVAAMSLSSASDRHYVIDSVTGAIVFGDGVHGRIPPAGRDNVVARSFRTGGGTQGLCAPRSLTEMKTTIAYIDSVINHEPSFGGADEDTVDAVRGHGAWRIKSRDRAVTAEDYEWLSRQAAGEVARSRCLPLTKAASLIDAGRQGDDPGWVTVIIVPQGQEDRPLPTEQRIASVTRYLTERSSATLSGRIDVIGPRYVPIDVSAVVVPTRIEEAKTVEKRVADNLRRFLHPLSGGPDGDGWEFGRTLYLSEIAAVAQGSEGVDQVRNLELRRAGSADPQDRVVLASNDLPASGEHDIVATGG